jgi:hypothetical protein
MKNLQTFVIALPLLIVSSLASAVSVSGNVGSITTISKATVTLTGVSCAGEVGGVLVWSLIDDTQTKNYANINTDQSSSFAEINETQTPNWEEVA